MGRQGWGGSTPPRRSSYFFGVVGGHGRILCCWLARCYTIASRHPGEPDAAPVDLCLAAYYMLRRLKSAEKGPSDSPLSPWLSWSATSDNLCPMRPVIGSDACIPRKFTAAPFHCAERHAMPNPRANRVFLRCFGAKNPEIVRFSPYMEYRSENAIFPPTTLEVHRGSLVWVDPLASRPLQSRLEWPGRSVQGENVTRDGN